MNKIASGIVKEGFRKICLMNFVLRVLTKGCSGFSMGLVWNFRFGAN